MAKLAPARTEINPRDFLEIDHLLGEEDRMIRDTVRKFNIKILNGLPAHHDAETAHRRAVFHRQVKQIIGHHDLTR